MKWQAVRDTHEELRRQVEASAQRCDQVKAERERAKAEWGASRDELREMQAAHKRLEQENERTEEEVGEQLSLKKQLEDELRALEEQHQQIQEAHRALEVDHRRRQFVLDAVSENLSDKQGQLQRELVDFQEQFEKAKAHRERIAEEQARLRETTKAFYPEHCQAQTEHAAKTRELEQMRRERDLLNWEHYKVQRDSHMLSQSYDVGALPPLVAALQGS